MKENRHQALEYILAHEGGYAERPEEGGGAVNMGVTFAVFEAWVKLSWPDYKPTWSDLKALTRLDAEKIYDAQYLDPIHFDDIPAGLDYCVLDAAVLGGVTGSIKLLQTILGLDPVDGHFGLRTRWAVNHRPAIAPLIETYCGTRLGKYRMFKTRWNKVASAKTGKTWGQIWSERINTVKDRALKMAGEP